MCSWWAAECGWPGSGAGAAWSLLRAARRRAEQHAGIGTRSGSAVWLTSLRQSPPNRCWTWNTALHDMIRYDMTLHGKTWQGKTFHGKTWHGKTWHGKTWHGKTWHGKTWHCTARHDMARHDMALYGWAWLGMELDKQITNYNMTSDVYSINIPLNYIVRYLLLVRLNLMSYYF